MLLASAAAQHHGVGCEAAGAAPGLAGSVASIGLRGNEDGEDQADEGDHEHHNEGGRERNCASASGKIIARAAAPAFDAAVSAIAAPHPPTQTEPPPAPAPQSHRPPSAG